MKTKRCGRCNQDKEKSLNQFPKFSRSADGLAAYCKICNREYLKEYREKNKERRLADLYLWRQNNPEKQKAQLHRHKQKLKVEVLTHYAKGNLKCSCGENDIRCLSIDHVDGGGNQQREELGVRGSTDFYLWLKQSKYPEGFQVLCMNCQWKKKPLSSEWAEKQKKLKLEVFEHYGRTCSCGETDIRCLSVDHVNDDGAVHRREVGNFYYYLKRNNYPNEPPLQVLCMNCQWKKEIDRRI